MDYLGVALKEGIEWRVLKALGLVRVRVQRKIDGKQEKETGRRWPRMKLSVFFTIFTL